MILTTLDSYAERDSLAVRAEIPATLIGANEGIILLLQCEMLLLEHRYARLCFFQLGRHSGGILLAMQLPLLYRSSQTFDFAVFCPAGISQC